MASGPTAEGLPGVHVGELLIGVIVGCCSWHGCGCSYHGPGYGYRYRTPEMYSGAPPTRFEEEELEERLRLLEVEIEAIRHHLVDVRRSHVSRDSREDDEV